jgi:RNA polymerase sigma-70 factor (ECF subfamily)
MSVRVTLPAKKESIMGDAVDRTPPACNAWLAMFQKAQVGDTEALNRLAGELRPELIAMAKKALPKRKGGLEDASDVAQKSLMAVCQNIGDFRGTTEAEFHAWLKAIVKNKAFDVERYEHQPGRDERRKQALPLDSSGAVVLAADTSSPSQQATRHEEETLRDEAFDRLPPDDQQVLRLHFREKRTWSDTAHEMGRTEAAVKRLYFRAIKRWKQEIGENP